MKKKNERRYRALYDSREKRTHDRGCVYITLHHIGLIVIYGALLSFSLWKYKIMYKKEKKTFYRHSCNVQTKTKIFIDYYLFLKEHFCCFQIHHLESLFFLRLSPIKWKTKRIKIHVDNKHNMQLEALPWYKKKNKIYSWRHTANHKKK